MTIDYKLNLLKNTNLIKLEISSNEKGEFADYLDILEVRNLMCEVINEKKDNSTNILKFTIDIDYIQECSITLEPIEIKKQIIFHRIVKRENPKYVKDEIIHLEDEDIYFTSSNMVDLKEMILEEILLNIDPFIKK